MDDSSSKTPLSDILIAFQKSLARAQRHTSGVRRATDFILGERTLYSIDGLDIELKVGLELSQEKQDSLLVDFHPTEYRASSVRFRVQAKPTEAVENGLVLFRASLGDSDVPDPAKIIALTVAQGRPISTQINIHFVPLMPSAQADRRQLQPANASTEASPDPMTIICNSEGPGSFSIINVTTNHLGVCVIEPTYRSGVLSIRLNGEERKAGKYSRRDASDLLVYASIGSAKSEFQPLFLETF